MEDSALRQELARACLRIDISIARRESPTQALMPLLSHTYTDENSRYAIEFLFRRGYLTAATDLGEMLDIDAIEIGECVARDQNSPPRASPSPH